MTEIIVFVAMLLAVSTAITGVSVLRTKTSISVGMFVVRVLAITVSLVLVIAVMYLLPGKYVLYI